MCVAYVYTTFRLEELQRKRLVTIQPRHPPGCIHTVSLLGPLRWCTINMFRRLSLCLTRCIVQSQWERGRRIFSLRATLLFGFLSPFYGPRARTFLSLLHVLSDIDAVAALFFIINFQSQQPGEWISWKNIRLERTKDERKKKTLLLPFCCYLVFLCELATGKVQFVGAALDNSQFH